MLTRSLIDLVFDLTFAELVADLGTVFVQSLYMHMQNDR